MMKSVICLLPLIMSLLISATIAAADPIAVEVTIQSVNKEARQITVLYNTKGGQKTISLDISSKAEVTLNGKKASLESLGVGLKAKVEYHKDLAIVTKINATGTVKLIDPVIRLTIQVSEFGEVTFSACKTNQAAPDDFEGTVLEVPSMPGTKAWKGTNGQTRFVHTFGNGAKSPIAHWNGNVGIDEMTQALVFTAKDNARASMSSGNYFQRIRLPATIIVDLAQHGGGRFEVMLMSKKLGQLKCIISNERKTPNKLYAFEATWMEWNAEKKQVTSRLLTIEPTTLNKPMERTFRLPVPNAKIDAAFVFYLIKLLSDRPTKITRLELRGEFIPSLGITLAKQSEVVFAKYVSPGSLGEKGGVKTGDIIKAINGKQPQTVEEAKDILSRISFGQEVSFLVERAGTTEDLRFKPIPMAVDMPQITASQSDKRNVNRPEQPIKDRLAGTQWTNSNGGLFHWTKSGRFFHNGNQQKWKVLDNRRVQIIFGQDHRDTLIFDDSFTHFKQLVRGGPKSFTGKRKR